MRETAYYAMACPRPFLWINRKGWIYSEAERYSVLSPMKVKQSPQIRARAVYTVLLWKIMTWKCQRPPSLPESHDAPRGRGADRPADRYDVAVEQAREEIEEHVDGLAPTTSKTGG